MPFRVKDLLTLGPIICTLVGGVGLGRHAAGTATGLVAIGEAPITLGTDANCHIQLR
jgi:hypothetical protein